MYVLIDTFILWDFTNCILCLHSYQVLSRKVVYSKNSQKQILLRKKFAFFVATTSFANSLCENQDFNSYIRLLDERHTLPNRQRLTKDIISLACKGKELIKQTIKSGLSKPIATADIWSKKGLSSSYLGIIEYLSLCLLDSFIYTCCFSDLL